MKAFLFFCFLVILVSAITILVVYETQHVQHHHAPPVLQPSFLAVISNHRNSQVPFTRLETCSNSTHTYVEILLTDVVTSNVGHGMTPYNAENYDNLTVQTSLNDIIKNFQSLHPEVTSMTLRPEFIDILVDGKYEDADSFASAIPTFASLTAEFGCHWRKRNFSLHKEVKKVILVGIDGMGSHNMRNAYTPTLDSIRQKGKSTMSAWLDGFSGPGTGSGPIWGAVLTGVNSDVHGIKGNDCIRPRVKTVLEKAMDAGKKVAVLAEWDRFYCMYDKSTYHLPYSWSGATGREEFNGPNAPSYNYLNRSLVMEKINQDFDFVFVYSGSVDYVGHRADESRYVEEVELIDKYYLKPIWDYVQTHPSTILIVTSDHGHDTRSYEHSGKDYPVPLFLSPTDKSDRHFQYIARNRMVSHFIEEALKIN